MKRTRRHFTPEQKADIVNQIDTDRKNGMKFLDAVSKQDINDSLYLKWKKQFQRISFLMIIIGIQLAVLFRLSSSILGIINCLVQICSSLTNLELIVKIK